MNKLNVATTAGNGLPVALVNDGPGGLLFHCLRQSTQWDVIEINPEAIRAAESQYAVVLVSSPQTGLVQLAAPEGLPVVTFRVGLEDPRPTGYDSKTVDDPVEISLRRLLGDYIRVGIDCLSVVEWRPAEKPLGRNGPLDSVRVEAARAVHITSGDRVIPVVHQIFVASHTRSRIVTCTALGSACPSEQQLLERAMSMPDVFVAAHTDGFRDTAVLSEYFRDLGQGLGFFYETVLFDRTVRRWSGGITFTFACTDVAILPELLQSLAPIADTFKYRTSDAGAAEKQFSVSR